MTLYPPIEFHGCSLLRALLGETKDLAYRDAAAFGAAITLPQKMSIVFMVSGPGLSLSVCRTSCSIFAVPGPCKILPPGQHPSRAADSSDTRTTCGYSRSRGAAVPGECVHWLKQYLALMTTLIMQDEGA